MSSKAEAPANLERTAMTKILIEEAAVKLALEALEYWDVHGKLHQPTEEAITAIKQALAQPAVPNLEPVHGDVLPPMGGRVYIRHGHDDDAHPCTVVGYCAWPDRHGNKSLHRVFVRVVYEGTDTQNTRFLHECWPTAEAALATNGITEKGQS
jgi:hypothetical protein